MIKRIKYLHVIVLSENYTYMILFRFNLKLFSSHWKKHCTDTNGECEELNKRNVGNWATDIYGNSYSTNVGYKC